MDVNMGVSSGALAGSLEQSKTANQLINSTLENSNKYAGGAGASAPSGAIDTDAQKSVLAAYTGKGQKLDVDV